MEDNSSRYEGDLALISKHRDALMGIAALIIFAFHEFLSVTPDGTMIHDAEEFILRVSFYGVDIFMLLSGMSVACSLIKSPDIGRFYLKRAKRILPFYILSGIVKMFLAGWSIKEFFLNVFGINFFLVSVNSYLWFIIAIILFYLAAPFYQKLLLKFNRPILTFTVTFVLWYIISIALHSFIREDFYYAINRMPVFMLGMLLGNLINSKTKIKYPVAFWTGIGTLFIIGWLMSYLTNYYGYIYVIGTLLNFVPRMALGISVTFICAKILDLLNWNLLNKSLAFVGSFCLELYIVQLLLDYKLHYFLRDHNIWGIPRNLIMLVVLGTIAFLSARLVKWCVDKICSLDIGKQKK